MICFDFFVVENIWSVLDDFFSCRGWIEYIWCGIGDFLKICIFFKNMMSFSLAEGELKIYDVGLMVRRLQRKKRNISKTPDKEIRKIGSKTKQNIFCGFRTLPTYSIVLHSWLVLLLLVFVFMFHVFKMRNMKETQQGNKLREGFK